jgi:glutaminyl-tRNA synthetase
MSDLNPASEVVLTGAFVEKSLVEAEPGTTYQFERIGYFAADADSRPGRPVFNRTVTLKDTWAKVQAQAGRG